MNPTCSGFRRLLAALLKSAPCVVAAFGATALAGTSFISSFSGVSFCKLNRITGILYIEEFDPLYCSAIPYIKAWYNSLFQHSRDNSFSFIFPS